MESYTHELSSQEDQKMTQPINQGHDMNTISPQEFDQATIERCPKDEENPYSQINNALIRDASISPECRWLIIYLLSNKPGWKISIPQVIKHLSPHTGRDKVYLIVDEAIEAGYMQRVAITKGNLRNGVSYHLSERAKFKKSFRHPGFQDTGVQDAENTDYKKTIDKNEHKERKEVAHPADGLDILFFQKMKAVNPKIKEPNFKVWAKEFRLMMDRDGHSRDDIVKVIEYLVSTAQRPANNGFCWANVVLCARSLRKQFAKLWGEMGTLRPIAADDKENAKIARIVTAKLAKRNDIQLGHNYIEFVSGQKCVHAKFDDIRFKEILNKELQIRKLNIVELCNL